MEIKVKLVSLSNNSYLIKTIYDDEIERKREKKSRGKERKRQELGSLPKFYKKHNQDKYECHIVNKLKFMNDYSSVYSNVCYERFHILYIPRKTEVQKISQPR